MSRLTRKQPATATAWPEDVLARFVNVGGATVELHNQRFSTKTDSRGYYHPETSFEVGGFNWRCLGCAVTGCGDPYEDRAYRKLDEARDHANGHAAKCRAMPRPGGDAR
jgi:hypothetical protein